MLAIQTMTALSVMLVTGMIIAGVCNTILNKYQDMQCVDHCNDPDPAQRRYFEQPVWQTLNMFVGECLVWIVYLWQKWRQRKPAYELAPSYAIDQLHATATDDTVEHRAASPDLPALGGKLTLLLWLPALCDLTATTMMNAGLLFTSASVYQMLRGAVVIFTGAFSRVFLNQRLRGYEWASLFLVAGGVGIVGLSSTLFPQTAPSRNDLEEYSANGAALFGVLLILGAQVFTASQLVMEEKILSRYKVTPLKAVGLEGIFGTLSVLFAMALLHLSFGQQYPVFDVSAGFHDIVDHPGVWQIGLLICISIAFFNWFGLSITKFLSATTRSTVDTSRTLFIWMVSLSLGWETFAWVQVIGFVVMVLGTFYYNGVIRWPFSQDKKDVDGYEQVSLVDTERPSDARQ